MITSSITSGIVNKVNLYKMWVFGYGSLVWKVDFPYDYKLVGYIKGFDRRFYQHSTDHRGTKEKPGRVVTLIPSSNREAQVWGVAYKIKEEDVKKVVDHLDYREKGGYERMKIFFFPKEAAHEPFEITIYVATTDNFQYAGEADLDSIAKQIISCVGPSGKNIDYIFNLANTMRTIAPHVNDEHLFSIEARVKELMNASQNNIC